MQKSPKRNQQRNKSGRRGTLRSVANASGSSSFYKTEVKYHGQNPLICAPLTIGGFPDTMRVRLRYDEILQLTSTSGVPATYVYRGNSVFDPNETGGGAQPANFDDFAVRYAYYRVLGSRCTVIFNNGSNTNVPFAATLHPWVGTAASATITDTAAQPYSQAGTVANTSAPLTLSSEITTSKLLGLPLSAIRGSDRLSALVNANPAEPWEWTLCIQAMDQSSTMISQCYVCLEYDVEFFSRVAGNLDLHFERLKQLIRSRDERLKSKQNQLSKDSLREQKASSLVVEEEDSVIVQTVALQPAALQRKPPQPPLTSTQKVSRGYFS
jgi:hypothetical protein